MLLRRAEEEEAWSGGNPERLRGVCVCVCVWRWGWGVELTNLPERGREVVTSKTWKRYLSLPCMRYATPIIVLTSHRICKGGLIPAMCITNAEGRPQLPMLGRGVTWSQTGILQACWVSPPLSSPWHAGRGKPPILSPATTPPPPLSSPRQSEQGGALPSTQHFGIHKNGNLLNKPAEKGSNENHNINYEAIGVIRLELMLLVPRRMQRASPDSTLFGWVSALGAPRSERSAEFSWGSLGGCVPSLSLSFLITAVE